MPESDQPNPQQPTDPGEWKGLSELSPAQREELASGIAPLVSEHLQQCIERILRKWKASETVGTTQEDPKEWSLDLARVRHRIERDFRDAVSNDLKALDHRRAYAFSGIEFAKDDSGLQFLDDYQSSRRSLRHGFESLFRADHGYSYFILAKAARERARFEHVNFAPWSPLNWFERLFEAAEHYMGRQRITLEFMTSYVQCIKKTDAQLLATVVEIVEGCGLVEDTSLSFESEIRRENAASWANFRQSGPAAGLAPMGDDARQVSQQPGHPQTAQIPTPAIVTQLFSSPIVAKPETQQGADSWAHWARTMLDASREETGSLASQGKGSDGYAGGGSDGRENSVGLDAERRIEGPTTRGGRGIDGRGEIAREGAGSRATGTSAAGQTTAHEAPSGVSSDNAALDSLLRELLEAWLGRIFEEIGFHPVMANRILLVAGPVAEVIVRDMTFFHDRSHPLRVWLGDLVNTGVRISPHAADTDHASMAALLGMIDEFADQLRKRASDMDRPAQEQFLLGWNERMSAYDVSWLSSHEDALEPFLETERRSRAQRGLTVCVLETGAELPRDAAEKIIQAWESILGISQEDSNLTADIKAVVSALCEKSLPEEIAPKIRKMFADAGDSGVDKDRIKAVINLLGSAHLEHIRPPADAPRFNPQENIRKRRSVRCTDDDPDFMGEQDDVYVFEASRMRVGLWYETVDRGTGVLDRLALIWRGEATRRFVFASLDGRLLRCHSLQGAAHEMREGRLRALPVDNALDAIIR